MIYALDVPTSVLQLECRQEIGKGHKIVNYSWQHYSYNKLNIVNIDHLITGTVRP